MLLFYTRARIETMFGIVTRRDTENFMRQVVTYTSQERVKQVMNELLANFFLSILPPNFDNRALHPMHPQLLRAIKTTIFFSVKSDLIILLRDRYNPIILFLCLSIFRGEQPIKFQGSKLMSQNLKKVPDMKSTTLLL